MNKIFLIIGAMLLVGCDNTSDRIHPEIISAPEEVCANNEGVKTIYLTSTVYYQHMNGFKNHLSVTCNNGARFFLSLEYLRTND